MTWQFWLVLVAWVATAFAWRWSIRVLRSGQGEVDQARTRVLESLVNNWRTLSIAHEQDVNDMRAHRDKFAFRVPNADETAWLAASFTAQGLNGCVIAYDDAANDLERVVLIDKEGAL